jgi:hypothetical protein
MKFLPTAFALHGIYFSLFPSSFFFLFFFEISDQFLHVEKETREIILLLTGDMVIAWSFIFH